jgi:hypothetical protein
MSFLAFGGCLDMAGHRRDSHRNEERREYCTISIYSVRPCDRDTFDGFGNSVLTIDYRDIKEISVDRVIDLINLWVTQ